MTALIILSSAFQLTAAFFAFRLISVTKKRFAWALISVAMLAMAARRLVPLYLIFFKGVSMPVDAWGEYIGLLVAFILMLGIIYIAPIFYEIDAKERLLTERTLDLERSNRDLEQFAYVASHDLQEPLRMISSFTQLLEKRYSDKLDKDAKEFIGFAVSGATRMQVMINDLLTFSRISTRGKEFEPVDTQEILGRVHSNLVKLIEDTRAVITHDSLPRINADPSQFALLLQNLIQNAIKFRKKEVPVIHIAAKKMKNEWVFSVQDNGIGIEKEFFDKIFVIFQRLHARDEYPGTGIGLAACKKIVERHKGRIWVESEPEKGSTFYFSIPEIKTGGKENE